MRHVKCKYGCLGIRGSYKSVDECSDLIGYDAVTLGAFSYIPKDHSAFIFKGQVLYEEEFI